MCNYHTETDTRNNDLLNCCQSYCNETNCYCIFKFHGKIIEHFDEPAYPTNINRWWTRSAAAVLGVAASIAVIHS